MKKLLIILGLPLFILSLVSSSSRVSLQSNENKIMKDTLWKYETNANPDDLVEEITVVDIPKNPDDLNELQIEVMSESYSVTHEKDGTFYTIILLWDSVPFAISRPWLVDKPALKDRKTSNENYKIHLLDQESNLLQSFYLETDTFAKIKFMDVNLDGCTDIVVNTGGTINEMHELYIWDFSSQNFTKVIFEGFDMLAFFEVYDGYVKNFLRGNTPEDSVMEKLIWNGNNLIKESEY